MNVNNFGLYSNNSKSIVSRKDLDSKFILLTKNLQTKVDKAGDDMTGDLNMGSNKICNVGKPVNRLDVANKEYVDLDFLVLTSDLQSKMNKAGDSMTDGLNVGSNKITGVLDPTS